MIFPPLKDAAPPRRVQVAVGVLGLVLVALVIGAVVRVTTSDDPASAVGVIGTVIVVTGAALGLWAGERFAWMLTLVISSLHGFVTVLELGETAPRSGAMALLALRLLATVVLLVCLGSRQGREYYARR